jgi:hypothetical protein
MNKLGEEGEAFRNWGNSLRFSVFSHGAIGANSFSHSIRGYVVQP